MFHKKNVLFSEDIEPRCQYCMRATPLGDGQLTCRKKGVIPGEYACRAFLYDPTRRIPPKPAKIRGAFTADDFALKEES